MPKNHTSFKPGSEHRLWKGGRSVADGYVLIFCPEHPRAESRGYVREHVLVAEAALGHYLPAKAIVHHSNNQRSDNRPSNLVVCENQGYHRLLHARIRALSICGNANLRRCYLCDTWDSPDNMVHRSRVYIHTACSNENGRRQREKQRGEIAAQAAGQTFGGVR